MSSHTQDATARRRIVVLAVATLTVAAVVALVVGVRASSSDDAEATAQRYVDLIASGEGDDLSELASMTESGDTRALVDAADLLAAADERIEVLSLGDPKAVEAPTDLPADSALEDFTEVDVRYRLAGEEHTWPLVLGRDGEGWRVASAMVGSVGWDEPGLQNVDADIRLGRTLIERRPRIQDGDDGGETVQPLYPAVYQAEKGIDPYFASTTASVVVLPGAPTAEPPLPLTATDATREAIATDFARRADSCGGRDAFGRCPFFDLVQTGRAGGDPYAPGWWKGLAGEPTIAIGDVDDGIEVSGAFRYVARDGVRTMRFTGTGQLGFEAARRTPKLAELEVESAG